MNRIRRSSNLAATGAILCVVFQIGICSTTSNSFIKGVLSGLDKQAEIEITSQIETLDTDLYINAIEKIELENYRAASEDFNYLLTKMMMNYLYEENKQNIFEIILSADRIFLNSEFFEQLASQLLFQETSKPLIVSSQKYLILGDSYQSGKFFGQFLRNSLSLSETPNFKIAKALGGRTSPYDEFVQDVFRGLYDGLGYAKNENIFKLISMNQFNMNDFISALNSLASSSKDTMQSGALLMNTTFSQTENVFKTTVETDQNFLNLFESLRLSFQTTTFFTYRLEAYRARTGFDAHYSLILASDSTDMGQYYSAGLYLARSIRKLKTITQNEDYSWPLKRN